PCGLYATLLRWAAAVVRQRGDVLDGLDGQAGGLQGGDGGFAARAWPLDANLDLLEAELGGPLGRRLGRALGGERRALAAAFEADRAGRGETQRVAVGVGDGDDGVVKRRLDVGDAPADVAPGFAFLALGHGECSPGILFSPLPAVGEASKTALATHLLDALLAGHGLARALARAGVGPRTLAAHRQAAAVTQPAV